MNKFILTKLQSLFPRSNFIGKVKIKKIFTRFFSWTSEHLTVVPWRSSIFLGTALLLLLAGTGVIFYLNNTTSAAVMFINGQQIGVVSSIDMGKKLVDTILQKRGQAIDQIAKTHDQIEYKEVRLQKANILKSALGEKEIASKLDTYVDGFEMDIAGSKIAILPSDKDIQTTLKAYQDYITKPSDSNKVESVSFSQDVTTKKIETQPEQVQMSDKVLKMLEKGNPSSKDYVVQKNDSWWLIARKNDMLTKDVLAGNPGATEDTLLKQGQTIKLVSITPFLSVNSKGVYTTTETIAFDVQKTIDDNLSYGETVVKQQGINGSKVVTYSYTQKDGKYTTKQVLNEQIVKAPITQIVSRGPSEGPLTIAYTASRGSGKISSLAWPIKGNINSYYGYRSRGFHSGIDIAGHTGDPFTASASGKVVEAGWDGAYGNMILIDHGNGVMTRYGHASKLLVSAGQYVNQGQTIALVGATGDATGPHLHFEIIINGSTVNPLDYLP